MNKKIWDFIDTYKWGLPVLSALLLIAAVPPVNFWALVFIGHVPLFLFYFTSQSRWLDGAGAAVFGFIFAGYLTQTTLSGFHWLAEADFFVTFVKTAGFLAAMIVAMIASVSVFITSTLLRIYSPSDLLRATIITASYILFEFLFSAMYAGFNYGALFFAASNVAALRELADLGNPIYISLATMGINLIISFLLLFHFKQEKRRLLLVPVFILLFGILCVMAYTKDTVPTSNKMVSVAIIQDSNRQSEKTFGSVQDNFFTFPLLEQYIKEAAAQDVDMIIYPFAPWSGVISEELDNSRFDRDVIGMSDAMFSDWLRRNVPEDVVFVAWYTAYRDGEYFNQIGYFKNGEPVSVYKKEKLFPFFDYVPDWALALGIVSLPFDAIAGTDNKHYMYNDTAIGSLVCSEIGSLAAIDKQMLGADLIFSLGSETMFNHEIPAEYNAMRSQLSAERYNTPVLRGNKFGPSVVYDANGLEIGRMEFEETGVLIADILVPGKN